MTGNIDPNEIGEKRSAGKLERGDHVLLADGRFGLLLDKPVAHAIWKDRLTASVSIGYRHTEGVSWPVGAQVFSRTPEEQIRYVEATFAELKPEASR